MFHFVEQYQVVSPASVCMHVLVPLHRSTEAGDNEGSEREDPFRL